MTTPTFNKFKSTTIYGAFNNLDYEDNTVQASSNIQRNLTVGGDIVVATGNIKGKKLYYDNVDISTLFASLLQPQFRGNIDITVIDPILNPYTFSIYNSTGAISMNTYTGTYPLTIKASNLQLSKNNGTNYYDVLTSNTGALKSGATFTGNVLGITATTTDNTTKFATTAFVKAQNYVTNESFTSYTSISDATLMTLMASLSSYALLSGATFTGTVNCNNGLTTTVGADVHISCNNTFPTTNSGSKQGLGFFWNKSGGIGETNLLCYGQGGGGGLSIWASNTTSAPSKLVEFYTMGCAFNTSVQGITPATSENSTIFATTAFVKNQNYLTSASLSSSYALLSGATFTGNVSGLTAITSDNTTKFATTAFVKAQNYISTNPDLSPYALLAGATFTGNVSGLTAVSTDNTTKFATTAFVKAQSYITSSSLSPYALTTALSNYALSSSLSSYALSSSLSNYALSSSLSNYALSSSLSNYALSSSLSDYALLSGATFTGIVNCTNVFNIMQPSSTSSAILQFRAYTGESRANFYSSVDGQVFNFSIQSFYNPNGFQWVINGGQTVLMSLDLSGNLITSGNIKCSGLLDSNNASGTSGQIPTANGSGGWVWSTPTTVRSYGGVRIISGSLSPNTAQYLTGDILNFVGNINSVYTATPVSMLVNGGLSKIGLINITYVGYVSNPTTTSTRVQVYCINNTADAISYHVQITAMV